MDLVNLWNHYSRESGDEFIGRTRINVFTDRLTVKSGQAEGDEIDRTVTEYMSGKFG